MQSYTFALQMHQGVVHTPLPRFFGEPHTSSYFTSATPAYPHTTLLQPFCHCILLIICLNTGLED